jgi:hypothetical protein
MTTAKINNQYDYITLRVKFADKSTFNLTRSRNGISVSGTQATRASLDFFDAWVKQQKGTIGEWMSKLQSKASTSATMQDFLKVV